MKRLDDAREDLAKALALAPEDEQVKRLYARAKKAAGAEPQPTQAVCCAVLSAVMRAWFLQTVG